MVIASAREGTLVAGLFYQNDVENYVEKVSQCYQKKSVQEAIESLQRLIDRQENEEI